MVSQNELLTLHLTCPEDSPLGGALRHLFYSNPTLLGMIENAGSPHSGGQHRLVVYGKRKDLVSWVELFVEEYGTFACIAKAMKHMELPCINHAAVMQFF